MSVYFATPDLRLRYVCDTSAIRIWYKLYIKNRDANTQLNTIKNRGANSQHLGYERLVFQLPRLSGPVLTTGCSCRLTSLIAKLPKHASTLSFEYGARKLNPRRVLRPPTTHEIDSSSTLASS